jgi:basic membrane protein A and related proteins
LEPAPSGITLHVTRRPTFWPLLALLAALLVLPGCGGDDEAADTSAQTATEGAGATTGGGGGEDLRIGLVTDIGGLDDRSFNFLANQGLERAEEELGVQGRVVISRSERDYVPNLSTLARQDYDLIVGVGFLMAEAVDTVAKQFPDANFAIIDFSAADLAGKPANVRGLLFKEQEAGYLAG